VTVMVLVAYRLAMGYLVGALVGHGMDRCPKNKFRGFTYRLWAFGGLVGSPSELQLA
jgi:hypothetical protein